MDSFDVVDITTLWDINGIVQTDIRLYNVISDVRDMTNISCNDFIIIKVFVDDVFEY